MEQMRSKQADALVFEGGGVVEVSKYHCIDL